MSTNAPAPAAEPAAGAETEAAPKKKFNLSSKKVKIMALLLVVMGAQLAVVYLILPSPSSAAHQSEGESAADGSEDSHGSSSGHAGGHGAGGEVYVTDISTSVSTNGGGTIFFVMFKLDAIVSESSKEQFSRLITEAYKARVKQAIVKVVRMSSMEDLNDPQLDVFKRNLRSEINNILPQRFIEEVIISDFRTMEQ